jgi:tetratricopeptide (TPR) repeat protein
VSGRARSAVVAAALVAAATAAAAQPRDRALTREEAVAGLASRDADTRRVATAWLGRVGEMADAPALLAALRDADELVRALAERSVWQVWSRSGDPETDALFARGVEQMHQGDAPAAIATFSEIIRRRPEFAEGWNKRATVYFLAGDYERSLADCHEVMARNPSHFGALAGQGQIYLALDQPERALAYFERALDVNPNLDGVAEAARALRRALVERRRGTI